MSKKHNIRNTVIRSLSAMGAMNDARFYAELFSSQQAEKFALIVIDPRCLKNPLLESLIGNLRILYDLDLTPTLLVGALDDDTTSIRFSSQRLVKDLESAKILTVRLNTESYGLFESVKKATASGKIPVLENTSQMKQKGLEELVNKLGPAKVIFLQPSGGINKNGRRIPVINIDDKAQTDLEDLTPGQTRFVDMAKGILKTSHRDKVFVIASPLNLLQELFTVKGSGTLIRQAANVVNFKTLKKIDIASLKTSIELGFEKKLTRKIDDWPIQSIILDTEYRAGAILTSLADITYLSKFWVIKEAQGEGLARDIWDSIIAKNPKLFWRSRMDNPFNEWYLKTCEGMQISGKWRVFWRGLQPEEIRIAILSAIKEPEDF